MGTWLYALGERGGYRDFDRQGTRWDVSAEAFKRLIQEDRYPKPMDWAIHSGFRKADQGDELYVYGGKNVGVIGKGVIRDVYQRATEEDDRWAVRWDLDAERTRTLLARPFPANEVLGWIRMPVPALVPVPTELAERIDEWLRSDPS